MRFKPKWKRRPHSLYVGRPEGFGRWLRSKVALHFGKRMTRVRIILPRANRVRYPYITLGPRKRYMA